MVEHQGTNNESLSRMIHRLAGEVSGGDGHWLFHVGEHPLICYTSEEHGRMRVISPVADARPLSRDELYTLLSANFDRALDAKYAIWQDQVWSTFVHPLPPLTEGQFDSAVEQVINLRKNFGLCYSSGELSFDER